MGKECVAGTISEAAPRHRAHDRRTLTQKGDAVIERAVNRVLDRFQGQAGYIFNLGSGILPTVPPESMETVFRVLRERR